MCGMPLPTGTLYQIQHKYWPDEEDYTQMSDADRMERQLDAYRGKFKKPLRRTDPSEPDHNVIDNRCEPIVSTGVDFLYGDELQFEVTDSKENPMEEAQDYLDATWDANNKMPLLAEYEINSAIFGHSFIKIVPDDQDTDPFPSLAVLNPMQMSVLTHPSDVRKVTRYAFTYPDLDPQTGAVIQRRQLTERELDWRGRQTSGWTIRDQIKYGTGTGMVTSIAAALSPIDKQALNESEMGWQDEDTIPWSQDWAPIHDCKNLPEPNSYWGKSDLRLDLIHLNDKINFILSNINRILYYSAHPQVIFFGIHARELDRDPGSAPCFPNTAARVEQIEMSGAGLAAAREYLEDLRESMDELSHVPSVAVGRLKNLPGVPSGVALKVAYRPLIAQSMQKRSLRSAMFVKLCQHILELAPYDYPKGCKITLHWPEMLPTDDLQEAQTSQIWQSIGASADTLLQRGGFDPDVEADKKLQETQDKMNAIAKGQALPMPGMMPSGYPSLTGGSNSVPGNQPSETGQAPIPGAAANTPPVNHPAAQAQRAKMAATAKNPKLNG